MFRFTQQEDLIQGRGIVSRGSYYLPYLEDIRSSSPEIYLEALKKGSTCRLLPYWLVKLKALSCLGRRVQDCEGFVNKFFVMRV